MAQPRMDVSVHGDEAVLPFLPGSGAGGALTLSAGQLPEVIVGLGLVRAQLLGRRPPGLAAAPVQTLTSQLGIMHSGREGRRTKRKLFVFVWIEIWILSYSGFNKIIKHVSYNLPNVTTKD